MIKQPKVNFSLRREVFFVTLGSLLGAFTMFIPKILMDVTIDTQYYIIWLVFARVIDQNTIQAGILLHVFVATVIGLVTGLVLYKGKILNISKISNGIIFGIIAGMIAFVIFYIPVYQVLIAPNMIAVMTELDPQMSVLQASESINEYYFQTLVDGIFTHLIWGITLGVVSTILTTKFGTRYRCHSCDIQFSKIKTYEYHYKHVHETPSPLMKHILILGGGFGGVRVLKEIQKTFEEDVKVDIKLVSEDNFFLFTPMLPEMATGTIEPRHISTPIRTFCKRARFFEGTIESIDLKNNQVVFYRDYDKKRKNLKYDYLVISLGSRNNFFGNKNIEKHSLTVKTLGDAIGIRNHIITMLENADQEDDPALLSKFLTFVIVGGGFSGVETAGELNDFVRDATSNFYRNPDVDKIRVILVASKNIILPEVGEELGCFALESLKKNGIEIIANSKAVDAGEDFIALDNGQTIQCGTFIWAGGIAMDPVIANLDCDHDKKGSIIVNDYLQIPTHKNVYALGDCASITDKTGKPYPPTAQHALKEAETVSKNLIASIKQNERLQKFEYVSRGTMAKIGKRNGVTLLLGNKVHGFLAWAIWRQYYLSNLPTKEKRIRVAIDWAVSFFFRPNVTRLRNLKEKSL
jgi:NADH dehydrogenase